MSFLEVRKLTRFFGGLAAVMELDMDVQSGRIFGLIGPNGAGKSTVLNILGGSLRPSRGRIIFKGEDMTRLPAHERTKLGIARVFQENLLFRSFSVLENVLVGYHLQSKKDPFSILFTTHSRKREERELESKALETLDFVGLGQYANEPAANLPHGRQRLLALATALAAQPRLLLLDEPVTGMNAEEIETMLKMIRTLRDRRGITCIIIEHNLKAVMGLCDRIAVLNFGIKIAEGSSEEIVEIPAVMEAYLGKDE